MPVPIARNDLALFAETNFRKQKVQFGIKRDDRRRHVYIIGKTGMGKSVLQENLIIQDIYAGNGVCVVDPHGDLVEKIVQYIPAPRLNDVIYFNPADQEHPIAFNVLESVDASQRHLISSGIVGVFKKIYAESWGPRLEYVLRNAILALLEYPGSTLLGILRILTDKSFRRKVLEKVSDPVVRAFWIEEYSKYPDRFQAEAIAPIQNKVGQFLSTALVRNIIGQVKSSIDMRQIMDEKKILLLNLAKGRIGEDNTALLGSLLITKIQLAAMSRVNITEEQRQDFYLYVDEFQNFATDSFADILSEARKYRLNLIVAHQYIEQLSDKVKAAVFGNVGTIICFRVGGEDAEFLEKEFLPVFEQQDLVNLPKYNIYLKLMIDGVASDAFSATSLPPIEVPPDPANVAKIIQVSRERYATPRTEIEEKINRWSQPVGEEGAAERPALASGANRSAAIPGLGRPPAFPSQQSSLAQMVPSGVAAPAAMIPVSRPTQPRPAPASQPSTMGWTVNVPVSNRPVTEYGRPASAAVSPAVAPSATAAEASATSQRSALYETICQDCGTLARVPFKPDGIRPVFCHDCLRRRKEQRAVLTSAAAPSSAAVPTGPVVIPADQDVITPASIRAAQQVRPQPEPGVVRQPMAAPSVSTSALKREPMVVPLPAAPTISLDQAIRAPVQPLRDGQARPVPSVNALANSTPVGSIRQPKRILPGQVVRF